MSTTYDIPETTRALMDALAETIDALSCQLDTCECQGRHGFPCSRYDYQSDEELCSVCGDGETLNRAWAVLEAARRESA